MASQNEVVAYIEKNMNHEVVEDGAFQFVYDMGNGRDQLVFAYVGEPFMMIFSPFAKTEEVTPQQALNAAQDQGLGIGLFGSYYVVKNMVPIADIDPSEIHIGLDLAASIADGLEKELVGRDAF